MCLKPTSGDKDTISVTVYYSLVNAGKDRVIIPEINRAAAESKKLHVLCYLGPEFTGFSVGALFNDAALGVFHMKAYERVALVSDVGWIRASVGLMGLMVSGPMRGFSNAELDAAREWVSE